MEGGASFEDSVNFSAREAFKLKPERPEAVTVNDETLKLFEKIKVETPKESVIAIEKLIDMIGKDGSMTLKQVKELGKRIPKLREDLQEDLKKSYDDLDKYPLGTWTRFMANVVYLTPITSKSEAVNEAAALIKKIHQTSDSENILGDEKLRLENKINEVILVESAKAVPEFAKVMNEGETISKILDELDFLVSYTEGESNYGTNVAFGGARSKAEMFIANMRDASQASVANASAERLNKLLETQVAAFTEEPIFGASAFLASLNEKTEFYSAISNFASGMAHAREASAKKAELEKVRIIYRERLDKVASKAKEVVDTVRKDLGLPKYKKVEMPSRAKEEAEKYGVHFDNSHTKLVTR